MATLEKRGECRRGGAEGTRSFGRGGTSRLVKRAVGAFGAANDLIDH